MVCNVPVSWKPKGDRNQLGCGDTVTVLLNNTYVIKFVNISLRPVWCVFVDIQDKLDGY